MKMSLTALRLVVDSNIRGFMEATARNNSRAVLQAATKDTITDSSTGTVVASLPVIATQNAKVTPSGANLASRAGYNAAIVKVNNAIAVLRDMALRNGFTPLGYVSPTGASMLLGGDGTVATQGTVPALDKTVTGVDGSGGDAMLRTEFNASVTRARNNLATILRAYNALATSVGVSTVKSSTGGNADQNLTLSNNLLANTAVAAGAIATGDFASKAAADAALLALANTIATTADKFKNSLLSTATLSARVPIILTR